MKPGELYAKVGALAESKEQPNIHERDQPTALALRISDDRSLAAHLERQRQAWWI
jgi:hypothetical protein